MQVLEILSSPETGPYWVSPLYREDSLKELAGLVQDFLDEDYNESRSNYRLLDIGGGSGMFAEEVVDNYPDNSESETFEMLADILDMAPPEHARDISETNDNIELIEGRAPEDIPSAHKYDFISLINTGQYFDDDEFSGLVDEIYNSLTLGGRFLWTSTYSLVDLFGDLEEFSDKQLVHYEKGKPSIGAEVSISHEDFSLEGFDIDKPIKAEVEQTPREFGDYILEILGEDGKKDRFSGERFGVVEAFTDIEGLMKCIESISAYESNDDIGAIKNRAVNYPWGVVKKVSEDS